MDDAHESLPGCKTSNHFLADSFFPYPPDEVLHYRQRDVRFQQRHAHFTQCVLDIVFRQARFALERLDNP